MLLHAQNGNKMSNIVLNVIVVVDGLVVMHDNVECFAQDFLWHAWELRMFK